MGKIHHKQIVGMIGIGVILAGIGLWKDGIGEGIGQMKEAPLQSGEKMWRESSPNSYRQVMEELDRLNQLFKKSVGLHETFIAAYKEEGHIPRDYKKQLEDIVVASPYNEVEKFVAIHKQYKIAQKEYFNYINQQSNWDKAYLQQQEQAMTSLIQQYIDELQKIKENQ